MKIIYYYFAKLIQKIMLPAIIRTDLDVNSKVCSGSNIVDSTINRYTYVGKNCTIINCSIGKFCSIADNVIIGGASHPLTWVSTSPVFHEGKNILNKNLANFPYSASRKSYIGNDVWIGNNALIKSGVSVHNGAVIGMGSVVTKDVGAYEVWAGNPAVKIKNIFNPELALKLNNSNWWDMSDEHLENYIHLINDPVSFVCSEGDNESSND